LVTDDFLYLSFCHKFAQVTTPDLVGCIACSEIFDYRIDAGILDCAVDVIPAESREAVFQINKKLSLEYSTSSWINTHHFQSPFKVAFFTTS
jgi:hypothetical protein